jgi:hypothetical protein
LYFNIEKKSYGNIDEVEKHSHQNLLLQNF